MSGGGAERVMSTLLNAFVERGEEVYLATNTSKKCAYALHKNIILKNLSEGIDQDNTFKGKVQRFCKHLSNIRNITREVKPDIIISFIRDLNIDVILATFKLNIPVIVSEHIFIEKKVGFRVGLMRKITYPFANAVTLLTRHDLRLLKGKHANVVYMPNPIRYNNANADKEYIKKNIILAAGRVSEWYHKGFDNLIRCWGGLCRDFPDWELHIAGAGDEKSFEYLKNIAENNNIQNLSFLGFRTDISKLMQESSVFCLSSRFEGLPMVLLEAMNNGCCCVAFNCKTGPNEIIKNNENGVLVPDQDMEELNKNLRIVMSDEVTRKRLSANSHSTLHLYSEERIISRWDILFRLILKNS